MPRMTSNIPARKVMAGSVGAAVGTIAIWLLTETTGLTLPPTVEAALLTVIVFAVGYVVPPSANDTVDTNDGGATT